MATKPRKIPASRINCKRPTRVNSASSVRMGAFSATSRCTRGVITLEMALPKAR